MKVSELLSKAEMTPVHRGRNVKQVGCVDGYFLVRFHTGALWVYGPNVPDGECEKLLRVPYPDKLFTINIKNKFKAYKVQSAA